MTVIGWIQILSVLRNRGRAGQTARLVHDARLQRRVAPSFPRCCVRSNAGLYWIGGVDGGASSIG